MQNESVNSCTTCIPRFNGFIHIIVTPEMLAILLFAVSVMCTGSTNPFNAPYTLFYKNNAKCTSALAALPGEDLPTIIDGLLLIKDQTWYFVDTHCAKYQIGQRWKWSCEGDDVVRYQWDSTACTGTHDSVNNFGTTGGACTQEMESGLYYFTTCSMTVLDWLKNPASAPANVIPSAGYKALIWTEYQMNLSSISCGPLSGTDDTSDAPTRWVMFMESDNTQCVQQAAEWGPETRSSKLDCSSGVAPTFSNYFQADDCTGAVIQPSVEAVGECLCPIRHDQSSWMVMPGCVDFGAMLSGGGSASRWIAMFFGIALFFVL